MRYAGEKVKHSYFNIIIRHAWKEFLTMERKELFACKMIVTSSAYRHCGIFPFNMEWEGWTNVIESLGKINKELRERSKDKGVSE